MQKLQGLDVARGRIELAMLALLHARPAGTASTNPTFSVHATGGLQAQMEHAEGFAPPKYTYRPVHSDTSWPDCPQRKHFFSFFWSNTTSSRKIVKWGSWVARPARTHSQRQPKHRDHYTRTTHAAHHGPQGSSDKALPNLIKSASKPCKMWRVLGLYPG